jgi:hypothetical protein
MDSKCVVRTFKEIKLMRGCLVKTQSHSPLPQIEKKVQFSIQIPVKQVPLASEYSDPEWESDAESVCSDPYALIDPDSRSLIFSNALNQELRVPPTASSVNRSTTLQRSRVISWIIRATSEMQFLDETLFLAVTLFDRIVDYVPLNVLQLYVSTCLLIASKMEEKLSSVVSDFVYLCGCCYTLCDFVECEREVLTLLHFDVAVTTSIFYVQAILPFPSDTEDLAFFFSHAMLFSSAYATTVPSVAGLAAIFLAALAADTQVVAVEYHVDAVSVVCCAHQIMAALEGIIENPENPLWELFRSCDRKVLQQTAERIRPQLTEMNVCRVFRSRAA